jgi:hypothetical protein
LIAISKLQKEKKMRRISIAIIILILGLTYGVQDKGVTEVVNPEFTGTDFTIPQSINFQGYLYQAGSPVTDTMNMWFGIYDASSGGSLLYQITINNVEVIQGYFNVVLTSIPSSVFPTGGPVRYLEIKAPATQPALSPRTQLVSVGYGFHSLTTDTAEYAKAASMSRPITPPIYSTEIRDTTITTAKIKDGTVTNPKLGANAVTTDKIQDGTILTADLSFSPATRPLAPGVATNEIADGAVTTAKIADGAVTESKLVSSAVTTNKIASNAVTSAKIGSGEVNTSDIADDAVTVDQLDHNIDASGIGFNADELDGCDIGSDDGEIPVLTYGPAVVGNGVLFISSTASASAVCGSISSSSYAGVRGIGASSGNALGVGGSSVGSSYYTTSGGVGTSGANPTTGVYGIATASSGDRKGGYFSGGGYAYVGANISGTNYKIYGSGNVSTVMPTRGGKKVLYAPESPEPYFEDFGHGKLTSGYCHIELDLFFLDCIKTDVQHLMKVFIQLNDDCNGVYVKVGQTGFDVYELQNGKSNASFTYRVLANRNDTDYLRFPSAPEPAEAIELK